MYTSITALTAVGLCTIALAADQCYFPDGSTSTDVPCNSSATHSACCGSSAYCLSNGVCMSRGIISRGSCTDQNWDADECTSYCTNYNTGGGYAIMACTNSTFTCGVSPDKCSVESSVFTMSDSESIVLKSDQLTSAMEQAGVSTGTSTNESDSDASSTSVSVVTVTATGSAVPVSSDEMYTAGQMAGVGAGIGVPLLLAVAALSWLLLREKRRTNAAQPAFQPLQSSEPNAAWTGWDQNAYQQQPRAMPMELGHEQQVLEIDTAPRAAELEPKCSR